MPYQVARGGSGRGLNDLWAFLVVFVQGLAGVLPVCKLNKVPTACSSGQRMHV